MLAPFFVGGGHRVMNTLSLFNFKGHDVRVVVIDDEPWWVAADACRALGLDLAKGTHNHLLKVSPEEKRPVPPNLLRGKGTSNITIVSESGLYKLVMRSDKPEARAFQNWVTREVLPAIRKDGSYVLGEEKVRTGEMAQGNVMCGVAAGQVISPECNSCGEAS